MKKFHKRKFKLSIEPIAINDNDKEHLVKIFKQIKELKALKFTKDDSNSKKIRDQAIQNLRFEYNDQYAFKFWKVTVSLGPHKESGCFHYYPCTDDVLGIKDSLVQRLSSFRLSKNTYKRVVKEFHGIQYGMLGQPVASKNPSKYFNNFGGGSVFEENNTIVNMYTTEGYKQRIHKAKKPYDKSNYVGVELELVCKLDKDALAKKFIDSKLAGFVYIKHDGSIRYKEGEYPHEVTLIAKQNQIIEIVTKVCNVLTDPSVGAYVNNSCGLHVHLDMRAGNIENTYKNFYKCLPILAGMVPQNRVLTDHAKRYCAMNQTDNWQDNSRNRYVAINTASYNSLKTIEIRLHSGSVNATKICNWIQILMAIANRKDVFTKAFDSIDSFGTTLQLDTKVVEYIKKRTEKFKVDKEFDTDKDHLEVAI